jgi:hypothetical protein
VATDGRRDRSDQHLIPRTKRVLGRCWELVNDYAGMPPPFIADE